MSEQDQQVLDTTKISPPLQEGDNAAEETLNTPQSFETVGDLTELFNANNVVVVEKASEVKNETQIYSEQLNLKNPTPDETLAFEGLNAELFSKFNNEKIELTAKHKAIEPTEADTEIPSMVEGEVVDARTIPASESTLVSSAEESPLIPIESEDFSLDISEADLDVNMGRIQVAENPATIFEAPTIDEAKAELGQIKNKKPGLILDRLSEGAQHLFFNKLLKPIWNTTRLPFDRISEKMVHGIDRANQFITAPGKKIEISLRSFLTDRQENGKLTELGSLKALNAKVEKLNVKIEAVKKEVANLKQGKDTYESKNGPLSPSDEKEYDSQRNALVTRQNAFEEKKGKLRDKIDSVQEIITEHEGKRTEQATELSNRIQPILAPLEERFLLDKAIVEKNENTINMFKADVESTKAELNKITENMKNFPSLATVFAKKRKPLIDQIDRVERVIEMKVREQTYYTNRMKFHQKRLQPWKDLNAKYQTKTKVPEQPSGVSTT